MYIEYKHRRSQIEPHKWLNKNIQLYIRQVCAETVSKSIEHNLIGFLDFCLDEMNEIQSVFLLLIKNTFYTVTATAIPFSILAAIKFIR